MICFSIPANQYIGKFLLGIPCNCWELSRLWAPDGHRKNLLTEAISLSVQAMKKCEEPDVFVSYADPNVGHAGGIYRAASWVYTGQAEESRYYEKDGQVVARRKFHSGSRSMTKAEILALGYSELKRPGRHRFAHPATRVARRLLVKRWPR